MSNVKKFAVILSGCGVFDGSEIHEAVMTLYAITRKGATYEIFAPDIAQHHVINHVDGSVMNEARNVLVESARIARGKIKPLSEFNPELFDASTIFISIDEGGLTQSLQSLSREHEVTKKNIDTAIPM